jgi:F-type H+-transporting ATPase subunit delta
MSNYRVAARYAKSLLELAIENKKLEKVKADMDMFNSLCLESRPFYNFIKNPIINSYKKLGIFQKLFEKRIDDLSYKFIGIITSKGREDILPEIVQQFLQEYRIYKNIEIVNITTPVGLDEGLKQDFIALSKKLVGESKKVELQEKVDEDLLGGFILRIGDKQIDDSVSSKLRDLKKKLIVS